MGKLTRWIARKLAPDMFRRSERYDRLIREIEDGKQWLSYDFPEVGAFAKYLATNDHNHWRALDEQPVLSPWQGGIDQFRERLRRGEAKIYAAVSRSRSTSNDGQ